MIKYNFEYLTWFDFENLARDVVEAREDINLEGFAIGRDKGIDFRCIYDKDIELIIQCKHYKNYGTLFTNLKKEAKKVAKLKPSRYILVTSINMTPPKKDDIIALFHPYIINPSDVICGNDVGQAIDKSDFILKKNHKLWLTSSKVLELILQKKIVGRTNQLEVDIKKKAKLYVETEGVNNAISILTSNNYVIIAGPPGIGKTTLAQILSLYYVKDGYELAYVTNIDEAEDIIKEKQIIYYDDFLGSNRLNSMPYRNEDKRLANLLRRVQTSNKTKLVMTTREYILRQAQNDYEELNEANIDTSKVVIELSSYTTYQRAHILYNHLYYSELDNEFIKNILTNKNYEKIIGHRNYNPRLIEAMVSSEHFLGTTPDNFTHDFISLLDNPARVWEKAFETHITGGSRFLLYALLISPTQVSIDELSDAFYKFIKLYNAGTSTAPQGIDLNISLKELDDTFVKIDMHEGFQRIQFANPSIIDFLIGYVDKNKLIKGVLLDTATHIDPILKRFSLNEKSHAIHASGDFKDRYVDKIVKNFSEFQDVDEEDKLSTLRQLHEIHIACKGYRNKGLRKFIIDKASNFKLPESYSDYDLLTYISLLHDLKLDSDKKVRLIIKQVIHNVIDIDDLKKITTLNLYYEDQLNDIALTDTIDLPNLFTETVDDNNSNLAEFDEGELETLLEEVEDIESSMGYNLNFVKEPIEKVLLEKRALDDDLSQGIDQGETANVSTDIDGLFQTLKN